MACTRVALVLGGAFLVGEGTAFGQAIATLEASAGQVTVLRLGQPQTPSPSMPLQLNDILVTRQGRASVRFLSDGTVLRIGSDSRVQIDENATQRDIKLFFGRIWAHVIRWKERPTRFSSGSTIAAIRGTELILAVASDGNETVLAVLQGRVEAKTDAGRLDLEGGQVATAAHGRAPAISVRARPLDAVQWALYYPPVLYTKPGELGAGDWQSKLGESTELQRKGDLQGALDSLDKVAEAGIRDPRFFTQRASLRLATGNVEGARKDIEQALTLDASSADALALKTIISVATNHPDEALATAQKAVAADAKSAAAQIALSYARQAKFDLEGARASLERAIQLDPGDALAWARLAEIRSSLGQQDAALEAARKATELAPNLSRTQTVLGYSYLMQVKTAQAKAAFGKAIELDASDPLPRLGLGLARIREGRLAEGSREIEVAVSLDPGQALLRSYLGKAYFEAKREDLVGREYDLAKQADPKDPTPWLYDAIAKQTTNRPVEALRDNQKAIELNDNRAVYRSRLLLDADLAARSASLGRVYSDLGFQDLALVEGWKSLNTDVANYSAHRLLADSYAARPRHEIARVSELFQSQMLQPLNTTPIQPRLGESNLFLISSLGPGALAFNEFNPLFNRDQVGVQGSFLVGEDDTLAGEGIVSGIYRKLSFSAGYSGFKTDGFRENATQDDKIANAFVQAELSPKTSVQAEVRYRDLETGDLSLNFDASDYFPQLTQTTKSSNGRFGLRHDFAPSLTLLASYMRQDRDIDFSLPDAAARPPNEFTLTRDEKADSAEAQLLYRSSRLKAVAGAGYFKIDRNETTVIEVFPAPGAPLALLTVTTDTDAATSHANAYLYSYISLAKNLTLTLGVSGDLFDETGTSTQAVTAGGRPPGAPAPVPAVVLGEKDQANPKLGISWTSTSGTTLRAAGFRTLKRTLVTDQTLEPTQVAGFNQFFDDPSATRSWVYGAAVDQKLGGKTFAGVEFSERDLTIPQFVQTISGGSVTGSVNDRDGKDRLARAYLFAAPRAFLTLSAEYQYEELEAAAALNFPYSNVKTHRVPLSARFFHGSGLGAVVSVTYLDQEGDFRVPRSQNRFAAGSRSFWVMDAALRYRLPKRYGFAVFGVNNLTDETSTYQATDPSNLGIRPGRVVYGRVVLAVP